MAVKNSPAWEEHTWKQATSFQSLKGSLTLSRDETPSGFLKLSAEIRNKIYRLTLLEDSVGVDDMHPEQWHEAKEAGRGTRTSYKTKDHDGDLCSYEIAYPSKRCTFKDEQWKNAKVSYTLCKNPYLTPPTIEMLALNRQTRAEAIPIFYGGNKICFHSMSAVLPFLQDRSELSLQSMQFFHLNITVMDGKSQSSRQQGWARIFTKLPQFGPLNLRKLMIRIYDPFCRYAWKLKLDTKMQRWVHEMAKNITNLDMLGVTFDFSSYMGSMTPNEIVKEESPTQELLWEFLAPKMLKKVGDEPHDARSLLERRIRDEIDFDEYDADEDEADFLGE